MADMESLMPMFTNGLVMCLNKNPVNKKTAVANAKAMWVRFNDKGNLNTVSSSKGPPRHTYKAAFQ